MDMFTGSLYNNMKWKNHTNLENFPAFLHYMVNEEIKFVADRMLGKLATYLLMVGFDTLYFREKEITLLLRIAREQNRIILTRDTRLIKGIAVQRSIFVIDDKPIDQVRQVLKEMDLHVNMDDCFCRCLRCNRRLRKTTAAEVAHKVPPYVLISHTEFSECLHCNRVYWKGTHHKRMETMIQTLADPRRP
ncbi:MAG: Mut7-C RNAse domain-containing protein [Deltaproteobacteria bacterium]|nr:Mut7-C RNAse domain-containing protein [Deltaproteobacteria bacterium]